jgi:hypothetical protein
MSGVTLLSPVLDGGIQNVNFVNGRVLTAEDLTAERKANLLRQRLLGRSLGDGVDFGLNVNLSQNSVAFGQQSVVVTAGLAINRTGDILQLGTDTEITLTAPQQTGPANAGLFAPCAPPETQLTNPGIYVLTIMPASGFQEQAPIVQLNSAAVATSCSSKFATAGVQFRLQQLTLGVGGSALQASLYKLANTIQGQLANNPDPTPLAPQISQLRNGLAYACFAAEKLPQYAADPLSFLSSTPPAINSGIIQQARDAKNLTDCEVPLALLYWTPSGIQFLDTWAVRRSVSPLPSSRKLPLLEGERRPSEAQAMILQFQDQLQSIAASGAKLSTISADSYFLFLPPAGLVQVTANGVTGVSTGSTLKGFDLPAFFGPHASKDVATTDGDLLRELMGDALYHEPVQLSVVSKIQLYVIWENVEAVNAGAGSALSVLFASPAMRYRGIPRFGTADWSLSRFAPRVI